MAAAVSAVDMPAASVDALGATALPPSMPAAKAALKPARRSRNSIFSDSWSFSSPTTSRAASPASAPGSTGSPGNGRPRRPSPPTVRIEPPPPPLCLPAASTSKVPYSPVQTESPTRVEAWDSVAPIDLSVPFSPHLALRTLPARPYLLGVGRHASVFLAACRSSEEGWRPCAAKRMNADREAQLGGFREAYILSKLYDGGKGPKSIVRLLSLRDERDDPGGQTRVVHRAREHGRSNSEATAGETLGGGTGIPLSPASTISADMHRSGSQSTPASPTVGVHPTTPSVSLSSGALVRRAASMHVAHVSPHTPLAEKRLSWSTGSHPPDVADPPRLVLVLECVTCWRLSKDPAG